MSVERRGKGWRVRYRDAAGDQRSRAFDRKTDADLFDAEVRRRAQLGTLDDLFAADVTLDHYVEHTWAPAHTGHLAPKTRRTYAWHYDARIAPRLGPIPLRRLTTEVLARFRPSSSPARIGAPPTGRAFPC